MSVTRRNFLYSTTAAAGLAEAALAAEPQSPGQAVQPLVSKPLPPSEIQVPKMKFGNVEISRLVCGVNPFYGYGHFNRAMDVSMREYYTSERVCDVLHRCNQYGINAFNYVEVPRSQQDLETFRAQGGKVHLICQGTEDDPATLVKSVKPLAVHLQGERTDQAFLEGRLEDAREYCKKLRDLGVIVGVGSHRPEVIATVEEEGWDVDFYAGCVYNRNRTQEEVKEALHGEMVEMPGEFYLQSDPARMYKVMRATKKPCFAFKVLAAGRVGKPEVAFRTAYESIKPTDGVFVGLYPRAKDEVRENAEIVQRVLRKA
jgi:hypothetical protein